MEDCATPASSLETDATLGESVVDRENLGVFGLHEMRLLGEWPIGVFDWKETERFLSATDLDSGVTFLGL